MFDNILFYLATYHKKVTFASQIKTIFFTLEFVPFENP